jgi:hypothetical protein
MGARAFPPTAEVRASSYVIPAAITKRCAKVRQNSDYWSLECHAPLIHSSLVKYRSNSSPYSGSQQYLA